LSTKVGRLLVPQDADGRMDPAGFHVPAAHYRVRDFTRDGVRRSVEDSLDRMGLDRFDVLYLHDAEEFFDDALRDGYPALAELRAEGVVGAIGAGMYDTTMLTTLVKEADIDVVMQSGRCTLLNHGAFDTFLPACGERGVDLQLGPAGRAPAGAGSAFRLRDRLTRGAGPGEPDRRRGRGARRHIASGGHGFPGAAPGCRRYRGRDAVGRGGPAQPRVVRGRGSRSGLDRPAR
jgi:hypothetical protein